MRLGRSGLGSNPSRETNFNGLVVITGAQGLCKPRVGVRFPVGPPILSEKMGRRTNHFDHEAYYASKSMKELQEYLKTAEEFSEKYPQFKVGWYNEYIHMLKLRIAERIGKKG